MERRDGDAFEEAPVDALRDGPVWLVDAVRGHCERVADHGAIAAGDTGALLVLYGSRSLHAVVPIGDIVGYETLAAAEAARLHRIAGSSDGVEGAERVTLVYALTGIWD